MLLRMEELKKHYLFSKEDEKNLKEIREIVLPYTDEFANDFYEYLLTYAESAQFFRTPEAIARRKETIKDWLVNLLTGPYDSRYLHHLEHVGRVHVKKGIPIHWVTVSMNFKGEYLHNILEKEVRESVKFRELTRSLDKILDINLDVLTSTYHEEEIKQKFLTARMDTTLISFAERFSYGINIILVVALIGLSLGVIGLFGFEVYSLFANPAQLERSILTALGTLLIIWVMIELIGTEIKYLKGERFHIEVFISVALVTFIRELLVSSLARESITWLALMLSAILVLGLVYYLISRTEIK